MDKKEYWRECIADLADECGVILTSEHLDYLADGVKSAHENIGMAFYQPDNPMIKENDRLKKLLSAERDKISCPECNGRGRIYSNGPYHGSDSSCWKCNGEGKTK